MNSSDPKFKTFASRQSMDFERCYTDGPLDPPKVLGLTELRQLVEDDNYGALAHPEVLVEYFGITGGGHQVPIFPLFWEASSSSGKTLGPSDRLAGFSTDEKDRWLSATDDNLAVSLAAVERWEKENLSDDDAEERYDASQMARAIREPLSDDPVGPAGATREERWDDDADMGDYEGRQAECDAADAFDDIPF